MKRPAALQAHQIEKCADFLEAHPAFSPVLCGQEALVCGFIVGKCFFSIEDMERLLVAPRDSRLKSLLSAAAARVGKL